MAEAESNADIDVQEHSRNAEFSSIRKLPDIPDSGTRVEEVLGKPTAPKSSPSKSTAKTKE